MSEVCCCPIAVFQNQVLEFGVEGLSLVLGEALYFLGSAGWRNTLSFSKCLSLVKMLDSSFEQTCCEVESIEASEPGWVEVILGSADLGNTLSVCMSTL